MLVYFPVPIVTKEVVSENIKHGEIWQTVFYWSGRSHIVNPDHVGPYAVKADQEIVMVISHLYVVIEYKILEDTNQNTQH